MPKRGSSRAVRSISAVARRLASVRSAPRERNVHRREHDLQRFRPEHHRDARAAGQVRQEIGVPLPGQPRARERELVHRRRGDGRRP